jgi:hypothetical protein
VDPLIALALVAALALLVLWWWLRRRGSHDAEPGELSGARDKRVEALDTVTGWPPEPTRVLNHAERKAHALLVRAVPECLILAQVPLARFIRVPTRNSYHEWMRRVGQLCADLIVCDEGAQVLAVVEVRRDPSKASERSRKRHERMDRVLHQAGVRVLVWSEGALPAPEVVRELVLSEPPGLHSEEGGVSVRTLEPAHPLGVRTMPIPVQPRPVPAQPKPKATLEEVLEELDQKEQVRRQTAALAEPPSSTWMDEFDSSPVPLGGPETRPR